jgi:predicted component of type VI protein secretion system
MEAKLVVVGGRVTKNIVPFIPPTVIGRGRDAKLTIAHPLISRRHCQIVQNDGLLILEDLGSLNGTFVNGQRIKTAPLPPDTEFTVGPLTFRVQYEYSGDVSKLPAPVLYEESPSTVSAGTVVEKNASVEQHLTAAVSSPDFQAVTTPLPSAPAGGALDDLSLLSSVGSGVSPSLSFLGLDDEEESKKTKPNKPAES